MASVVLCTLIVLLFFALYKYITRHYDYWKRKGIFSPELSIPFGHFKDVFKKKIHFGIKISELYRQHRDKKYVGLFIFYEKAIMINDVDLINNVLIKDFSSFSGHGLGFNPEVDKLANHLFNMDGPEWKRLRNKLTPLFTSNKLRYMYSNIIKCAENIHLPLNKHIESGDYVDFKQVMVQFTTDVIGSTAFGIETNSFVDPNSEFIRMGKKVFAPPLLNNFVAQLALLAPSVVTKFKLRIFPKDVEEFFVNLTSDLIKYRKDNNVTRNDFLQTLIDLQKEDEKTGDAMTLMEITAQVFLFFTAGFDTSSSAASFAIYELAKNPEIQVKLRKHINEVIAKHDGNITYECISEMNYLTWVIEETLRLYPPLPHLFRRCNNDYTIPGTNDVIEKGTMVFLPIMGLQYDPKVHDSPTDFKPERFDPEFKLKSQISIPFGDGPRFCIGNRIGMLQTKISLVTVFHNYEVMTCEKTVIPMAFKPESLVLTSLHDQYYKIRRLNHN